MTIQFTEVNIDTAQGNADDHAVMEKGKPETAITLMGWDEVGLFDHEFTNPVYVAWVAGGVASCRPSN